MRVRNRIPGHAALIESALNCYSYSTAVNDVATIVRYLEFLCVALCLYIMSIGKICEEQT